MARYVTPRGVEVEVSDEAARAVGYRRVITTADVAPKKKAPAKKSAAKKSDK